MNNMKIYVAQVVIGLVFMALQGCNASLAHLEYSEKCVNLKKCEPVMRLLRIPMIKKKIFKEVRQARCGSDGLDIKIYCDVKKIIYRPERFDPVVDAHWEIYMTTAVPPPLDHLMTTAVLPHLDPLMTTGVSPPLDPLMTTAVPPHLDPLMTTAVPPHLDPLMTTGVPPPLDPLMTSIDKHPNFQLLDHDICGPVLANSRNQVKTRIFGGRVTAIDEFPWMAFLAYEEKDNFDDKPQFRCGATVINHNHVMTAAHCVTNLQGHFKLVGVRIGEYNLDTEKDCDDENKCNAKYEDVGIDTVYYHNDFSPVNLHNDIAIIRLNSLINFTRTHVRPVCLPIETDQQVVPKSGIVTGWGSTENDPLGSRSLLKVTLPVVSAEECDAAYSDTMPYMKIWHKQFCAGGIRGMDSCVGDSGGPLQTVAKYRGNVRMVQRGIVSYGRRACGLKGTPGVYTSVAYYVRWILDTIGN